jgi:hypothetical protein
VIPFGPTHDSRDFARFAREPVPHTMTRRSAQFVNAALRAEDRTVVWLAAAKTE